MAFQIGKYIVSVPYSCETDLENILEDCREELEYAAKHDKVEMMTMLERWLGIDWCHIHVTDRKVGE